MANTLTTEQRLQAAEIYDLCRAAQNELWHQANELEKLIGCAVDTTEELDTMDLQDFIDKDEPV